LASPAKHLHSSFSELWHGETNLLWSKSEYYARRRRTFCWTMYFLCNNGVNGTTLSSQIGANGTILGKFFDAFVLLSKKGMRNMARSLLALVNRWSRLRIR
jgi:hypothetical protein